MKKTEFIMIIALAVAAAILTLTAIAMLAVGCINSKSEKSVDKTYMNGQIGGPNAFTGVRYVKVYDSMSREVLWEHEGVVFISEWSTPGNYQFIYQSDGTNEFKNVDVIGQHICVIMIDK